MYDAFEKSYLSALHRRRVKHQKKTHTKIPASFGVRHGLIKDPNWPPANFPSEGTATQRRFLRIVASYAVRIDGGDIVSVEGNISEGGVMFILPSMVEGAVVEVVAPGVTGQRSARVEVIKARLNGSTVVHHARFVDRSTAAPVWNSILQAQKA